MPLGSLSPFLVILRVDPFRHFSGQTTISPSLPPYLQSQVHVDRALRRVPPQNDRQVVPPQYISDHLPVQGGHRSRAQLGVAHDPGHRLYSYLKLFCSVLLRVQTFPSLAPSWWRSLAAFNGFDMTLAPQVAVPFSNLSYLKGAVLGAGLSMT